MNVTNRERNDSGGGYAPSPGEELFDRTTGKEKAMAKRTPMGVALLLLAALVFAAPPSHAVVRVQCPGDTNGDAVIDTPDPDHLNATCMHLSAGDGLARMGDGKTLYIFSFHDVTGLSPEMAVHSGMLGAELPAPTIALDEGMEFYLTLSNTGMFLRPDLFDPHTVHFHGYPNAASVFDGVPDASISINMGESLTYYYNVSGPVWNGTAWEGTTEDTLAGTYFYHCHVEATEHMELGMLGNLYVRPLQNRLPNGTVLGSHVHSNPDNLDGSTPLWEDDPLDGDKYVYNDGDGSTRYDVEASLLLEGFDNKFHVEHLGVQPLPFWSIRDDYPMLNGRGYPDTINPGLLDAPALDPDLADAVAPVMGAPKQRQPMGSLITATQGQRILLRMASASIARFSTISTTGLPMRVVGKSAKLLRGPTGLDTSYLTTSVTLGGGESLDAIIDTTGIEPGEYYLYATDLEQLNNYEERFGGMMTKIVINP